MPVARWDRIEPDGVQLAKSVTDVVATGRDDGWAVGYHYAEVEDEPLDGVLVRVGLRGWRAVERMDKRFPRAEQTSMRAVDAHGTGYAWAVGNAYLVNDVVPFALRWDGIAWHTLTPLGSKPDQQFTDVAIDGPRAVLTALRGNRSLLLSWNGERLQRLVSERGERFESVAARGGRTWIAGGQSPGTCEQTRPAVWHRPTSQTAALEPMRLPELGTGMLTQILQIDVANVWAVGERGTGTACDHDGHGTPLVLHWNGTVWQEVPLPGEGGRLTGITAAGPNDVWLAGVRDGHGVSLWHYDGRSWTREAMTFEADLEWAESRAALTIVPGTSQLWLAGSTGRDFDRHVAIYRRL
ncbi:hypothetical protein [Nonomuraea polychroma]|uniref:hypothetical protein n=1 Tax=Nonomuraea polychroma TaxID=46176 RepID=UPI000FDE88F4|nr:hypothetical protein [Nonomuraea polychroma]